VTARRSCLSVPGSSERMLAKAPALGADELVLDLEDAVAAADKEAARGRVTRLLEQGLRASVRVNAPASPWGQADLGALGSRPASVVLPKVEGAGDLAVAERALPPQVRLQALIETPAGLVRLAEIAAASERLDALILGYADLAAALGRTRAGAADLDGWRPAQEALLVAARANGLQAIDGPYLGVAADAGFVAAATRTRDAGFDGKWAIHPSQVEPLNQLFTPAPEELERARRILAALEGTGAVALDGEMVDEALAAWARRTLARAGG
jgi:citrate lyase subunit beta / citryl-CoA lyase